MIKKAEISSSIANYITGSLGYPVDLSESINLHGDIGLDSLDVVDLVAFIEDTYGVQVSEEEYPSIINMNIGEISDYILSKKYES